MNAVSNSSNNFMGENGGGSDSDASSDGTPEYYHPISAGGSDSESDSDQISDNVESQFHRVPLNGYDNNAVENGVSSLDLSDHEEEEEEKDDEEVENSEILRDEENNRRSAPLTEENVTRVMEAMRGVSFGGTAPEWVDRVPEDQWINRLRTMRRPWTSASQN